MGWIRGSRFAGRLRAACRVRRPMPRATPWAWVPPQVAAIALLVGTLAGCGYESHELFPQDVHTIAVPIFQNRTFYRGVEFDLTEALVKQIELRTPYKVTDPGRADTIIQGAVVRVDQRRLSRRAQGGVPQELEVEITVDFEWRNQTTSEVLRQRRGYTAVGRYVPTDPVAEPFEVAQHAAAQRLAEDIVSILAADW